MWIKLSQNTSLTWRLNWKLGKVTGKRGHTVLKLLLGQVVRGIKMEGVLYLIRHRWPRIWNKRRICNRIGKGAGIAQWLERRTRDWKVAGSNPCWNGGRIFFSRVDFLCWLLFRYSFHPRVTTVARKRSRSFCQKCRCQVTAKHAYTLPMWLLLNRASALVTTCP